MHCYELTDSVRAGLSVSRSGVPHIPTPHGCLGTVTLDEPMVEAIDFMPEEAEVRLKRVTLNLRRGEVLLKKAVQDDRLALLRICPAAGDGGRVRLTANAYDTKLERGSVGRVYRPFPDAGIQPLCTDDVLAQANEGVELLDILVMMYPGASFRVIRNGRLRDQTGAEASPEMFVKWTTKKDDRGGWLRALEVGLPKSHHWNEYGLQAPRPRHSAGQRTSATFLTA